MSGNSEEKTHPPSQQKLKKAREKGQVVTSKETLASLTTLAVLLYLFARRGAIWRDLRGTLADIADQVEEHGLRQAAVILVGRALAAEGFVESHLYSCTRDR